MVALWEDGHIQLISLDMDSSNREKPLKTHLLWEGKLTFDEMGDSGWNSCRQVKLVRSPLSSISKSDKDDLVKERGNYEWVISVIGTMTSKDEDTWSGRDSKDWVEFVYVHAEGFEGADADTEGWDRGENRGRFSTMFEEGDHNGSLVVSSSSDREGSQGREIWNDVFWRQDRNGLLSPRMPRFLAHTSLPSLIFFKFLIKRSTIPHLPSQPNFLHSYTAPSTTRVSSSVFHPLVRFTLHIRPSIHDRATSES